MEAPPRKLAGAGRRKEMDAKYYCDTMQTELVGLKARVYDIIRSMEKMPPDRKNALSRQMGELHGLVGDLSRKIDNLKMVCPADWSTERKEIEATRKELLEKIDIWDKEHIAGGYVGG